MDLPEDFKTRIHGTFGRDGQSWLKQLPDLLEHFQDAWSLTLHHSPFPPSYHYVIPCQTQHGVDAVLKLGVPNPELSTEINALRHFKGRGVVRLLKADQGRGGLLLERITPGTALLHVKDNLYAAQAAANVADKLWRPPPKNHPFPTMEDWGQGFQRLRKEFQGDTGPFPKMLVEKAEALFKDLLSSTSEPVLLHGDFHHRNLLKAQRDPWLTIDPKGLIGEPAYEMGAYLRNPFPEILHEADFQKLTAERIEIFADTLSLDPSRMIGWGFSQAVLAAWWSYEERSQAWEKWVSIAERLSEMTS
ncbi:MAG: aminoglycoside phosphotransferase family protein [Anaerolineales bacterium]